MKRNIKGAEALRGIHTEKYHFKIDDLMVAEMVKAYLLSVSNGAVVINKESVSEIVTVSKEDSNTMENKVLKTLQRIVDPKVLQLEFDSKEIDGMNNAGREETGENGKDVLTSLPHSIRTRINGELLAELIDTARDAMAEESRDWIPEDPLQRKVQAYMESGFKSISGKAFVSTMPVEFAEFITDCYLALRYA